VLVGPSGCGKTTTLRIVAGLEEPSDGEVWIGGRRVDGVSPRDRDVAVVFQNYALYPHMSVFDNMAYGLRIRGFARKDIAAVKVAMPKVLHDVCYRAMHLHGALGVSNELPLAGMWMSAAALGIALLVNSDLKGATVYRTIVFLSYPLMAVAVGIIWRWMYDERGGIINYALRASGLVDRPIGFLQDFDWALPSVIFAEIWQVLGFYMIILLTGLQSIPQNLYEAARIDGAPAWARFFRITVPMLRPSLFLCIVVGILNSFSSFDLVYIMTNGGPGHATELLITHIYKSAFVETKFDYAAALTVVQFSLLVVLTIAANRAAGGNAGAVERD